MKTSGIIYYHDWNYTPNPAAKQRAHRPQKPAQVRTTNHSWSHLLGLGMLALAVGGLMGPLTPRIRMETKYALLQTQRVIPAYKSAAKQLVADTINTIVSFRLPDSTPKQIASIAKPMTPAAFDPLKTPDGASIDPVNKDFSLIVPKIGINAAVLPAVNPTKPGEYLPALQKGIAHSSLSYFPDEDGTVYLFSHSTNYDWFVGDLNAVFYLLKNLEEKDTIVIYYKGKSYRYEITGKQIVKPTEVSYLAPQAGAKRLILQTCWPPGSVTERLLIFADLVEESNEAI